MSNDPFDYLKDRLRKIILCADYSDHVERWRYHTKLERDRIHNIAQDYIINEVLRASNIGKLPNE